ncbi:sodium channel protein Nach-like [Venturia canescens]|uniref:sodium channel protein Nach-like n=1 Tax=Venturia canescens TaxID=32260 RepID=UPI001C9D6040|nr:sodium channel protein Nach-like [Venturia canescens]
MRAKKLRKKKSPLIWRLLKRYLANSSIHGVKYLVEDGRHWTERLFWLLACGLSWWGCAFLIFGVLEEFQNRRTAITIQTNYIDWPIELPSIHLCSMETPDSGAYVIKVWKKKAYKKLDNDRTMGYERNLPEPHGPEAFEGLANAMKLNCSKLFEWCEWDGKEFDCCSAFRPLATPMGSCLSINSIFTRSDNNTKSDHEMQRFQLRDSTKPDSLRVRFKNEEYWKKFEKNYNLYLMGNTEIPSRTTGHDKLIEARWKSSPIVKIDIIQEPIYNENGVRSVPIEKRNCRFMDERDENAKIYQFYGYDACVIEADLARMYNICHCISHIYPRAPSMSICNQTQLKCVYESSDLIYNNQYPGCVPDCEATLYSSFKNFKSEGKEDGGAHFDVNFLPGPSRRFVRYVVHSKLDVVVSVGSALGLFVGASILSLVEIPYWIIVRGADDDDEEGDQVRKEN